MESEEILDPQFTGSWSTGSPISEKRFPITHGYGPMVCERWLHGSEQLKIGLHNGSR